MEDSDGPLNPSPSMNEISTEVTAQLNERIQKEGGNFKSITYKL